MVRGVVVGVAHTARLHQPLVQADTGVIPERSIHRVDGGVSAVCSNRRCRAELDNRHLTVLVIRHDDVTSQVTTNKDGGTYMRSSYTSYTAVHEP